jgi:SAM-dependent methyltransferase
MTSSVRDTYPPLTMSGWLRWDLVERVLDDLAPRSILEIGCGQGAAGARMAARSSSYVGVEPDAESAAIAEARIGTRGGTVLVGDDTAVPEDATYDVVCAFEVLEHLEDDAAALVLWQRLVRPGGHLVLSVPAWQERFGPSDELVGHFRRYDENALRALLERTGFTDVQLHLYGWPLGYALESVRNRLARRRLATAGSMRERSAMSGRFRQPKDESATGPAIRAAIWPFRQVQRLVPRRGVGLVAVARRPASREPSAA